MLAVLAVFVVQTSAGMQHAIIHRSRKHFAPQGTNKQESFKPKTITHTTAADIWSAGLMTNDMGTGFRLLGNPKCSAQLLFNIFDMFGMPDFRHLARG